MLRHPQCQRPPAAAQFEDVHPVRKFGPFADERQCRVLGLIQCRDTVGPVAARVFQPMAQAVFIETCRYLVVLPIGILCLHRDWALRELFA